MKKKTQKIKHKVKKKIFVDYGVGSTFWKNFLSYSGLNKNFSALRLNRRANRPISAKFNRWVGLRRSFLPKLGLMNQNIRFLSRKIYSFRGSRLLKGLPVRGQRTKTNAKTQKRKRSVSTRNAKNKKKISKQSTKAANKPVKKA